MPLGTRRSTVSNSVRTPAMNDTNLVLHIVKWISIDKFELKGEAKGISKGKIDDEIVTLTNNSQSMKCSS